MQRAWKFAWAALLLVPTVGCGGANRIVGHELTERGNWFGGLGITGHLNKITIEGRSELHKLSIIGDGNEVRVEDGALLGKVEIWGQNNLVEVPSKLKVRINISGSGSRVVQRGPGDSPAQPYVTPIENTEYEPMAPVQETGAGGS